MKYVNKKKSHELPSQTHKQQIFKCILIELRLIQKILSDASVRRSIMIIKSTVPDGCNRGFRMTQSYSPILQAYLKQHSDDKKRQKPIYA